MIGFGGAMSILSVENRRAARKRVLRSATISLDHIGVICTCTVRNQSQSGACLLVDHPGGVPNAFDLAIAPELRRHHCRVVWREGSAIGVEFSQAI